MAALNNMSNDDYWQFVDCLGITLGQDTVFQSVDPPAAQHSFNQVCELSSLEVNEDYKTGRCSGMKYEHLVALLPELSPGNFPHELVGFWTLPASVHQVLLLHFRTLAFRVYSEDGQPYQFGTDDLRYIVFELRIWLYSMRNATNGVPDCRGTIKRSFNIEEASMDDINEPDTATLSNRLHIRRPSTAIQTLRWSLRGRTRSELIAAITEQGWTSYPGNSLAAEEYWNISTSGA